MRSLIDLQQFYDPDDQALNSGISSAHWPLFGQVWPMSMVLAKVMALEPIAGKKILEIGCGIALPSLVAQKLGGDVTASDYHPLTQAFLNENTGLNSLEKIPYRHVDWNSENLCLGIFDLIIGSDVLYEQNHANLVSEFINFHSTTSAQIIIVDPGRGSHRKFARAMQKRGFSHTWTDLSAYAALGVKEKGFVLRFSRNAGSMRI